MPDRVKELVHHFETIEREHMRGIPVVNSQLSVEAVGFAEFEGHWVGVLITPWFMNLVMLPGTDEYQGSEQGAEVEYALPAGSYSFTVTHDDQLGTFMTAVLFRTVTDFPDQETTRDVAETVLKMLFREPQSAETASRKFSRRELFAQLGAS